MQYFEKLDPTLKNRHPIRETVLLLGGRKERNYHHAQRTQERKERREFKNRTLGVRGKKISLPNARGLASPLSNNIFTDAPRSSVWARSKGSKGAPALACVVSGTIAARKPRGVEIEQRGDKRSGGAEEGAGESRHTVVARDTESGHGESWFGRRIIRGHVDKSVACIGTRGSILGEGEMEMRVATRAPL